MSARIVIAGSSGLIGRALASAISARGEEATRLVRRPASGPNELQWDPLTGRIDPGELLGARAVVVLNGVSVGRMPWTSSYRKQLASTRLGPTRTIVQALRQLGPGAPRLVSASAVGFYGSAPGKVLTESDSAGSTFLAQLCQEWEAQALQAETVTDVALLRTAPVIHRQGVLGPLITVTALGAGGPLATGKQVWPWVSLDDAVAAILHIIDRGISGPVNVCGPTPATANDLGRSIARQLNRPYWLPVPAWLLNMTLGREAAESLLTADADARPAVLLHSGFRFVHSSVESAVSAAMVRT